MGAPARQPDDLPDTEPTGAPRLPPEHTTPPTQFPGTADPTANRASATRPAASHPAKATRTGQRRRLSPAAIFSLVILALLIAGLYFPTERYITPRRGFGYALGILGGSLMLLLFLYSARKRIRWLGFMGAAAHWFRFHMVLGVLGPLCILYHSNFSLGAANSNVALFCMLTVAGSGLIGRYIYARIHHGLYGSKLSLVELRTGAASLRNASGAFTFLPELMTRLDAAEGQLLQTGPQQPVLGGVRLANTFRVSLGQRTSLRSYARRALAEAARTSTAVAVERRRLRRAAFAYIDRRLAATRRVAGFQAYERLFSLWHALHLPLIFLMLVAGTVHVIAVHVY